MTDSIHASSSLSADIEIIGTIKAGGNIRIDGKVDGDIESTGDVVIGKTADINGNINVRSVSIAGHVQGNVNATDRIEMKSSARMHGDIRASRLSVEDGVTFIGRSEVMPTAGAHPSSDSISKPFEEPAKTDEPAESEAPKSSSESSMY